MFDVRAYWHTHLSIGAQYVTEAFNIRAPGIAESRMGSAQSPIGEKRNRPARFWVGVGAKRS